MFESLSKNASWPVYPLSRGLRINKDSRFQVDDLYEYRILGVTNRGGGVAIKRIVMGSELTMREYQRASANQLMWCKVDTKNGAFGVTRAEHRGCLASGNMCLADLDLEVWNPKYLQFLFQWPAVIDGITAASLGTTNRQYLKPQDFLDTVRLRLPPVEEQRRIVARIEELAAKIEHARIFRKQAQDQADVLFESALNRQWSEQENWNHKKLGKLAQTVCGQVDPRVEPYASLPHINGEVIESGTCRLLPQYRLAKEDGVTSGKYHFAPDSVLYSKIRPYLRKATQVPFEGVCSADVYAFEKIDPEIDPRFFMYSLVASTFTNYVNALSGRTRMPKVNQGQMFAFELAYPDLSDQRRIVSYLDNLSTRLAFLRVSQIEIATELDALMPSILDKAFRGEL